MRLDDLVLARSGRGSAPTTTRAPSRAGDRPQGVDASRCTRDRSSAARRRARSAGSGARCSPPVVAFGTNAMPSGSAWRKAPTAVRASSSRPRGRAVRKRIGSGSSRSRHARWTAAPLGHAPYVPWFRNVTSGRAASRGRSASAGGAGSSSGGVTSLIGGRPPGAVGLGRCRPTLAAATQRRVRRSPAWRRTARGRRAARIGTRRRRRPAGSRRTSRGARGRGVGADRRATRARRAAAGGPGSARAGRGPARARGARARASQRLSDR